jgi:hypothetical protein
MLCGMLSMRARKTMGLGALMRNGIDLGRLMRNGTGLRGLMNSVATRSAMVKHRQQQAPFKVFDSGREFDAAADNSTTCLIDGVHGQHCPSWANQTVNTRALSVVPPTVARTR